jgi:HD-GYP domain-containing protein (c-di-GMP phosphodiesterase class II)
MMILNVNRTISQLISAIAFALDIDEGQKLYHAWRVSIFGAELAKMMLAEERKDVFYACLLHDIGGIGFSDHIIHYLLKEEIPKDPAVLAHPLIGAEIVIQIPNMDKAAKFILNHHEWYNGRGYPLGRQREEIPLGAQIINISDHIDMLIRNVTAPSPEDVIKAVNGWRERQFSSALSDCAIEMLKKNTLYEEALDPNRIAELFEAVRNDTGIISMPAGVDAIGIACEVFSQLIDTKHHYTIGHSKRVSRASLLIGLDMGLTHDELTKIKWAGLLHDVGKLGISRKLLDKPGRLTPEEYELMKSHSVLTREILEMITDFKEISVMASADHERYDGKGYPYGLKGEEVSTGARIITLVDAFDAMTSDRSYRRAMSADEACEEVKKNSGTQFDPAVVKSALPILRSLNMVKDALAKQQMTGRA